MSRILFAKEGDGVWISHLDTMRLFQRAFRRADVAIRRTGGYSPRDHVSIALPLSVGVESRCELLEFDAQGADLAALPALLNATLPVGIRVLDAYESARSVKEIAWLQCEIDLEYDQGVPEGASAAIAGLLRGGQVLVEKKTKKGMAEIDIRPMLHALEVRDGESGVLTLCCTVHAQEPSLNPALLVAAIERYLPEDRPDFSKIRRLSLLDAQFAPFR